jgi:hypothetical protein
MPPVLVVLALPEKFFPENLFAQVLWPLVLREHAGRSWIAMHGSRT